MREIADRIATWREHPATMVRELFKVEPDAWQLEALEQFPHSPRMAMKACAGPGKTATLAWIGWNFMLTRPHPIGGAASVSGPNLKANLWTELSRWRGRSPLLMHLFEQTSQKLFCKDHPDTWKIEARSYPQSADATQIGNALAGLHGPYVIWLLDETGDMPDSVMPVCEGIFAGSPIEAHIVQAGNPTMLAGPLYRAATVARRLWKMIEITADPDDPKRTPRVSVEHARAMIEQYGRDNPWVKVRIFGEFPPSSLNALIGPDEVSAAMKRHWREHEIGGASRVLGVDVAQYGDDSSIIAPRQGIQMFPLMRYRNISSTQGAGQVSRKMTDWNADACFIDNTGGFGAGWIDQLILLGKTPIGVHFAQEANHKERYFNKRAEMAFEFVQWIKQGGALVEDANLLAALTQTTYTFKGDRLMLEPKAEVKVKLGYSPDEFDACMLTFAEPVTPKARQRIIHRDTTFRPFADLDKQAEQNYGQGGYDPFQGS